MLITECSRLQWAESWGVSEPLVLRLLRPIGSDPGDFLLRLDSLSDAMCVGVGVGRVRVTSI